jgi:carbamoylphosphate synthase large subunit
MVPHTIVQTGQLPVTNHARSNQTDGQLPVTNHARSNQTDVRLPVTNHTRSNHARPEQKPQRMTALLVIVEEVMGHARDIQETLRELLRDLDDGNAETVLDLNTTAGEIVAIGRTLKYALKVESDLGENLG